MLLKNQVGSVFKFLTRKKICRRKKTRKENERGIYVKHFKNIPMADLEIVLVSFLTSLSYVLYIYTTMKQLLWFQLSSSIVDLVMEFSFPFRQPEKKNPSLTPMDWVKFLVSAAIGLVSNSY